MNTRRYPRTLQQAFGPYTDHRVEPMPQPSRIAHFLRVFNQYRRAHSWRYAARIAHGIAFRGLPF